MSDKDNENLEESGRVPSAVRECRATAPGARRTGHKARWRDPRTLGTLLQMCVTVLLLALLIYLLFPFFAAARRLNLSMRQIVYVPIAIAVIVILFTRRLVRLVRRLRGEDA